MAIKTRAECRAQLGSILDTGVTNAQDVHDYAKSDFDQHTPVVTVSSAGTIGQGWQEFGIWYPAYQFIVRVFVLDKPEASYTEENADDARDDVMQQVFTELEDHSTESGFWQSIVWDTPSQAIRLPVGGHPYMMESLMVTVWVKDES